MKKKRVVKKTDLALLYLKKKVDLGEGKSFPLGCVTLLLGTDQQHGFGLARAGLTVGVG